MAAAAVIAAIAAATAAAALLSGTKPPHHKVVVTPPVPVSLALETGANVGLVGGAVKEAERWLSDTTVLITGLDGSSGDFTMFGFDSQQPRPLELLRGKVRKAQLPTIAPDRDSFVYLTQAGKPPPNEYHLWLKRKGASPVAILTAKSPCAVGRGRPAFSPSGRQLALVCADRDTGRVGLYVISLTGDPVRTLVDDGKPVGSPTWTDDGRIIFEEQNADGKHVLYSIRVNGHLNDELAITDGTQFDRAADWFGNHFLFLRGPGTGDGRSDIYVSDGTAEGIHRLTTSGRVQNACWSPDGTHIAYLEVDDSGEHAQLMVMDSDGTHRLPLAMPKGKRGPPAWGSR